MPTKKKRVGFIPRDEVIKIIERLSHENNLSNSKIINILVEEALAIRGMFDINKTEKRIISKDTKDTTDDLNNNNSNRYLKNINLNLLSNEKDYDKYDDETYQKFLKFLKFQKIMKRNES